MNTTLEAPAEVNTMDETARAPAASMPVADSEIHIRTRNLQFYYGEKQALFDINLDVPRNRVVALIGPSGCGKSTLIRCYNRMNDLIESARVEGEILIDEENIFQPGIDVIALRKKVGMVFQKSNPFPKSIFENVVYGLRIAGVRNRAMLEEAAERSLRAAALWEEVKD